MSTTARLATDADDANIRRMLREHSFGSGVSVAMTAEPSHAAAMDVLGRHQTVVVERDGRVVCIGTVGVRKRFVDGVETDVGYLSGLRSEGGIAALREGFEFFGAMPGPPVLFTSIAADNRPARGLLERGVGGLPVYTFVGDYQTKLVRSGGRLPAAVRRATADEVPGLVEQLNAAGRLRQFAAVVTANDFSRPGLSIEDVVVARDGPRLLGCAAVWDQRSFRQSVVTGYGPTLRWWKRLGGRLPATHEPIRQGYVCHFWAAHPAVSKHLMSACRAQAKRRRLDYLLTSAPGPGWTYRSRIYTVGPAVKLDGRPIGPDLALL